MSIFEFLQQIDVEKIVNCWKQFFLEFNNTIKPTVKNRITSIDLRRTGATNESLKNIIGNLKTSLEELSVSCDKITCHKLTR